MELKITKEKVLDAASKCSTAKATLEVLFPEAFISGGWERFEKNLTEFIRKNVDTPYNIYKQIPGLETTDKANWIVQLIIKNLPK